MDYFVDAWAATHEVERGFFDDPVGGPTMHGITERVARAHGYTGPMQDLPLDLARHIGKLAYWDPLRLDEIAQISAPVALELFDTNFNLFEGAAAQFFQRTLNGLNQHAPDLEVDGVIGSRTVWLFGSLMRERRNGETETIVLRCLNSLQCADYIRQANGSAIKRAFLAGWVLKRVRV